MGRDIQLKRLVKFRKPRPTKDQQKKNRKEFITAISRARFWELPLN